MKRALVLLLCACGLPGGDVLSKTPPKTFANCLDAQASGVDGDLCTFTSGCEPPPGGSCCTTKVVCISGVLKRIEDCSQCPPCTTEDACGEKTWCVDDHCVPCQPAEKCDPCPAGFEHLTRNGCATCECGPPSRCAGCAASDKCLPSTFCSLGCTGDVCCVQQCSPSGCGPSPEGCATIDCGGQSCSEACWASDCTCNGTGWTCTPKCSAGSATFSTRCKG